MFRNNTISLLLAAGLSFSLAGASSPSEASLREGVNPVHMPTVDEVLVKEAHHALLTNQWKLGLDDRHNFDVRHAHRDELSHTHIRINQTFKNLPIWDAENILHADASGKELPMTGGVHKDLELNTEAQITSSEALSLAVKKLDRQPDPRFPPTVELGIQPRRVQTRREEARVKPEEELNAADMETQIKGYTLAYKVHLYSEYPIPGSWDVMVDAMSGEILSVGSLLRSGAYSTLGKGYYNGKKAIIVNQTSNGTYEMTDPTRGQGQHPKVPSIQHNSTFDAAHHNFDDYPDKWDGFVGKLYTSSVPSWGDGLNYNGGDTQSVNGQTAAFDTHFAMQASYDFYLKVFGRRGMDGKDTPVFARVHFGAINGQLSMNPYFIRDCWCMTFGDSKSSIENSNTSLDIVAHEYSHGINSSTATVGENLDYGEDASLDEANSDIMGTMIEFWSRGIPRFITVKVGYPPYSILVIDPTYIPDNGGNWTIAEGVPKNGTVWRYMYKPSKEIPAGMDAWSTKSATAECHQGSGPMRRMFYFLSQGASNQSTSDYYSTYLPNGMKGLTNNVAARIWYRALTVYMKPKDNFLAARQACINAAKDLYHAGSAAEQAVWNAFAAVNVGPAWQ